MTVKTYKKNFVVQKAFGNLYRKRHALIFCTTNNNRIVVGNKPNFYPKGISRMIGGGISDTENETEGILRELEEETGIKLKKNRLIKLAIVDIYAKDDVGNKFSVRTYLYAANLGNSVLKPGDDIRSFSSLSEKQFIELITRFSELGDDNWYKGLEGEHSWGDYGKIYGFIHQVALNEAKAKNVLN